MTPGDRTDASTGGSLLARLRAAPLTLLVAVITLILTLVQVGWSYENISATRRLAAEHEQHLRLAREVGRLSNALLQAERAARAAAEQPSPAALARLREANDLLAGRAADVRRDTPPGWQERAQQVSELALVKGRGLAAGATAGAVVPSLLDDFLALAEAAERGAYEAGVTAAAAVDANRTRGYGIVRTAGAFALAMLSLLLLSAYLDARRHQRDLRAAHARAEALALTDPLTGLGNRRAFDADLDAALERAAREGEPLTLLAIDVDGLKLVNDREGHARGDRLLSAFGTALAGRLLAGDRVYRTGGDEFAAILPRQGSGTRGKVRERLQQAVEDTRRLGFPAADVSWGLASYPDEAFTVRDLVRTADARMYRCKARHQQAARARGEPDLVRSTLEIPPILDN